MPRPTPTRHYELSVEVPASVGAVFDHVDDLAQLAGHMEKSSAMMLGGRMAYQFDSAKGRATGSVIRMAGQVLGLALSVEEVVTIREPPHRKIWETRGTVRLLIIGGYRMGFEVDAAGAATSRLRVFIDYRPPDGVIGRCMGVLFGPLYARWCVRNMAIDAKREFAERTAE